MNGLAGMRTLPRHNRVCVRSGQCTPAIRRTRASSRSSNRRASARAASQVQTTAESRAESVIDDLERSLEAEVGEAVEAKKQRLAQLSDDIDAQYCAMFADRTVQIDGDEIHLSITSDEDMQNMAKSQPEAIQALLSSLTTTDADAWAAFQAKVSTLKLQRSELQRSLDSLQAQAASAAASAAASSESEDEVDEDAAGAARDALRARGRDGPVQVVLVTGFESFNQSLYRAAAKEVQRAFPGMRLSVFSDRDISNPDRRAALGAALADADVFFGSLLFDYDDVEWLKGRVADVPLRFVFESALELMSETRVGAFEMAAPGGKKAGPPPAVKKLLGLFGSGREEDRLSGYLSFLKVGPKILKFFPMQKAQDLRSWLTVYGYWNEGGKANIVSMLLYICNQFFADIPAAPPAVESTPPTGCLHPDAPGRYFRTPAEYLRWYRKHGALRGTDAPVAAVLLYRKHVITEQPYIPQLVRQMEAEGVLPVPVFINGVEAHTVVRDQLTTRREQNAIRSGALAWPDGLAKDAAVVDTVVSTIGFPLVGGPAGTMEGGRQAEVAQAILSRKNVPYIVAAPLLIQDLKSWTANGVAGLQSVVLYSLPELDGAIDTVPLGGLVGDDIFLIPERVTRLLARVRKWSALARAQPCDRRVAMLLYGFPPGVGATGTAALLNVPESLERTLRALRDEGYDLGPDVPEDLTGVGEALVSALKRLEAPGVVARGAAGAANAVSAAAGAAGAAVAAVDVAPRTLHETLAYPPEWGPTEWGPVPFLPRPDLLPHNMEKAWGDLYTYRGLNSTANGDLFIGGLQMGNVWIGVQPALGVEGDPMRLLFDRDLTPHPQYAAFYKFLENDFKADAVVHFGMHGTVEWLPGSPLGNSGYSWSDVLLSTMPNVYVYAANNPSESIIAKRRGYGTIVSHNVPPYGRAGLYKQLSELQALLTEFREAPEANAALKPAIADALLRAGMQKDCPLRPAEVAFEVTPGNVEEVDAQEFEEYCTRLYGYLQEVSNRLFSEGLHAFGREPSPADLRSYLSAYLSGRLGDADIAAIADAAPADLPATVQRLQRAYPPNGNGSGTPEEHAEAVAEAAEVRGLLARNTEEVTSFLKALNGEYVPPAAGGDLLRDGPGVLPTGRNIHALDPYRMPSQSAEARGASAGAAILDAHRNANGGALPETVAVNLWGLDSIKTRGDNVGLVLWLVGARPVKEGTGRVARFELIPLEELRRPRIDVLCNMSGIFRDSFQNVVELLDDMFQRAAAADEPAEQNFVKKHCGEMAAEAGPDGAANAAARMFSNPSGDYGSMVNERVGASNWTSSQELGDTWASRNAFSYGRGAERGAARPDVLRKLLATTDRVVQQVDSVEYGLTDIQEYYANTGALVAAAESARKGAGKAAGGVGCSVVEAFGGEPRPMELEGVLRMEYRSKLLNPKWAQAMAAQGSGGAFEISQRMTAMLGWGATVEFSEDWTWDQAAETYVLDKEMAAQLRANNPEAFKNTVARLLEASGRGIWNAPEEMLRKLQAQYDDLDEQLEKGV
eukprot:jgi/Ulvmu1/6607/UM003_0244.1